MEGDGSSDISLGELVRTPVACYKLSRHFLQTLIEEGMQGPSRRFLAAMSGAAQALNANIIGGGIDSNEAANALRLVGVRLLQGDALCPPVPPAEVAAALAQPPKTY